MKQNRKRTWTLETAISWVKRVDNGKEKLGLKYCSAKSYLRKIGKAAGI